MSGEILREQVKVKKKKKKRRRRKKKKVAAEGSLMEVNGEDNEEEKKATMVEGRGRGRVKDTGGGWKDRSRAQRRWQLLARALTRSPAAGPEHRPVPSPEDEISVRRFTSFDLIQPILMKNSAEEPDRCWYSYRTLIGGESLAVDVRRIRKTWFTADELMGFNNTGNVCVWPSEECLAYYLLRNRDICRKRKVLELGGGMSCLAGLFAAKYCEPAGVTLTDGNVTSVDNVKRIVARNNMADFVKCGVVQWAKAAALFARQQTALVANPQSNNNRRSISNEHHPLQNGKAEMVCGSGLYEVILSADCLFFDDARIDLVETIYGWLADNGIALLMAPKRGTTFQKFAEAAAKRGFVPRVTELYDQNVWSRHLELLQNENEYSPDLHYPILLELTKKSNILPG